MPRLTRNCIVCQTPFFFKPSALKTRKCIYCSKSCAMKVNSKHNLQNSKGMLGKKHSTETRKKLSIAHLGKIPWNKGKPGYHSSKLNSTAITKNCLNCGNIFSMPAWRFKDRPGLFCKPKCRYEYSVKENHSNWEDIPHTAFCKECGIRLSNRFRSYCKRHAHSGDRSPYWNGGGTPERVKAYRSIEYQQWRNEVFKRDNYTCVQCNARYEKGKIVILQADHIKPWILYPELRYEINNGQVLCKDCHLIKTKAQSKETNYYLRKKLQK